MKHLPDLKLLLQQANFSVIDKALPSVDQDDEMMCLFKDAYKVVRKYVVPEETVCTNCVARKRTKSSIGIYYKNSKNEPCYTSLNILLFTNFYAITKDTGLLSQEDTIIITKVLLMGCVTGLGSREASNGATVVDKLKAQLGQLSVEDECKLHVGLLHILHYESTYLQVVVTDSEFFVLAPECAFAIEAFSQDVVYTCRVSRNNALMQIVITDIRGHEYYLFNNKLVSVRGEPERHIRMGKDVQRKAIMLRGYPR